MLISTPDQFAQFERWAADHDVLATDTETDGLLPYNGNKVVGVSVGVGEEAFYLPFRHGQGPNLPERFMPPLIDILNSKHLIFHNAKFDLHMLGREGLDIDSIPYEDTMLAAHLVNTQEPSLALKKLSDKYQVGVGSADEEELRGAVTALTGVRRKNEWKGHMWKLPSAMVEPYASTDARLTWGLYEKYWDAIDELGFFESTIPDDPDGLYRADIEYNRIITRMERRGLLVDRELLEEYDLVAKDGMERTLAKIMKLNPGFREDFDPANHHHVRPALNVKSSMKEVLQEVGTETADLIVEYRDYKTASNNYYAKYRQTMNDEDILRSDFQQAGTMTGRLSCWNPNLQAISRYTERQPIKDLFLARPGWTLMEFDLSQAELRVTAYYAKVAGMMEIFADGRDLHSATAEDLGIPRDTAKRINLSAIYGIGERKFAEKYKMSREEANRWLTLYHSGYPEIRRFYKGMMRQAEKDHYITLPTGRIKRYLVPQTNIYDSRGFNFGEQKAASNYIQGTVAEIMRIAMTRIERELSEDEARMLLTVHDSILFEVRKDTDIQRVASIIMQCMTSFGDMPLAAEAKIGDRWGKLKGFEFE